MLRFYMGRPDEAEAAFVQLLQADRGLSTASKSAPARATVSSSMGWRRPAAFKTYAGTTRTEAPVTCSEMVVVTAVSLASHSDGPFGDDLEHMAQA